MAVTISGLYVQTYIGANTGLYVVNWDLESHKCALITNASTPAFSAGTPGAPIAYGNAQFAEVSGTGYTAGGNVITSTTVTESPATVLMFDAADVSWPNSTITGARAALLYADALTAPADPALCVINFGADYSTNNGTFTIQWAAAGIFTWDVY